MDKHTQNDLIWPYLSLQLNDSKYLFQYYLTMQIILDGIGFGINSIWKRVDIRSITDQSRI